MAKITTYQQLIKEIQKKANAALKDTSSGSVFDVVKETEIKHIQSDVFDKYPNPKIYERRSTNGLDDESNIVSTVNNNTLTVTNITEPNSNYGGTMDKNLPELIEYGHGYKGYEYDYPYYDDYIQPRSFTKNTIDDLEKNKQHIESLKNGLRKEGLNVK